jgi:alpha-glucosidase (family GH31 glycosyl hydrolase)
MKRCLVFMSATLVLAGCTKGSGMDDSGTMAASLEAPWPDWVLQHWVWEDESTQQSATSLVDDYLAHDIPVGAIIIDSPWATGYSTYEWDTEMFPDPQAMIDDFHSKGVRVFMWTVPGINIEETELYEYAASRNYFMQGGPDEGPKVIDWWKGDGSIIDYFNPEAVEWWHGLVDQTLDYGIDGWKCDGLDFSAILADYSPFLGREVERLEYSHAYYQDFHDHTRDVLGPDRVNTTRPVDNYGADVGGENVQFTPQEITWAGWVGDQDASFDGIKAALRNMYWSDHDGYTIFGSDIGGYRTDDSELGRPKDVLIRWAQLGALSAIMENGGAGEHRPWKFDEETATIYRQFTTLHHALIPYLMEEGGIAFAERRGLMSFTDKPTLSYQLGADLFVVPVLDETGTVTVRFPDGRWVYAFDPEQVFEGEVETSFTVPLSQYPLFFRDEAEVGATVLTALEVSP